MSLKMASLIANQLQENCQVSLDNFPPRERKGRITVMIHEVNIMLAESMRQKRQTISVDIDDRAGMDYLMEYERIQQIYMNLLQNAITHSVVSKPLILHIRILPKAGKQGQDKVVLKLRDYGTGMTDE